MSDPVAIPRKDKAKARAGGSHTPTTRPPPTMAMPTPSSHAFNYYDHRLSPASIDSCLNMTPSSQSPTPISARDKGKGPIRNGSIGMSRSVSGESNSPWTERRMSLLSSSISRSEHTVVNVGDSEGNMRLITCVKASQGFDWNQDIFLPSYAGGGHDYTAELEQRRDPVQDIFVTDEEAESMFPR